MSAESWPGLDAEVLYWSAETGSIGCGAKHTPFPGSDTWISQSWERVSAEDADAWEELYGTPMACEICNQKSGA